MATGNLGINLVILGGVDPRVIRGHVLPASGDTIVVRPSSLFERLRAAGWIIRLPRQADRPLPIGSVTTAPARAGTCD